MNLPSRVIVPLAEMADDARPWESDTAESAGAGDAVSISKTPAADKKIRVRALFITTDGASQAIGILKFDTTEKARVAATLTAPGLASPVKPEAAIDEEVHFEAAGVTGQKTQLTFMWTEHD